MSRYATASIVVGTALIGGFFAASVSANPYVDCNNPRMPSYFWQCKMVAKLPAKPTASTSEKGTSWQPTSKAVTPIDPISNNPRHPLFRRN